jgi:hypothetical protein
MVAAADAASDLRQVTEKGVVVVGDRTDKRLVRAQIDPSQGAVGGRGQGGQLLQGGDPVGPGRVRQAEKGLGSTDRTDPDVGHLLGGAGQVLDRAELAPGDRKHVDGPEQGRRKEPVRAREVGLGRPERTDGRSGQDAVRREALSGRLHRVLPAADVVGGHHHIDDRCHSPDHQERDHGGGDLPSSGEPPPARRAAPLGPVREVAARVAGLAALHRRERTAVESAIRCHPGADLQEI